MKDSTNYLMNVYEIFKVQQSERESFFYRTDSFAPLTP